MSGEYPTLAAALAATPADTDSVIVHREGCNAEPCTCRAFKVPYGDLTALGAERTAEMLAPFVERAP